MELKMGTIKIVADSSMTIEPELIKSLDITVVPLSVMIDSKLYSDNELKEEGQFLQLMRASKSLPKTSQPPVGLFADIYERLVKEGRQLLLPFTSHQLFQEQLRHHVRELKSQQHQLRYWTQALQIRL